MGELALFVSAWILALLATLNDYRSFSNDVARNGEPTATEIPAEGALD